MKMKQQQGYFLPLAVLFAAILTATWATQLRQTADSSAWHEASRVLDEILFWQQATSYYRIDFGIWPTSLTEVESSYNIPWLPNYLSGARGLDGFVIEYQTDNLEVIAKLPDRVDIGMQKVAANRLQLVLSESLLLNPNIDIFWREGAVQSVSTSIDVNQHNLTNIKHLEGLTVVTADGFSLAGSFTQTDVVALTSNRITADDVIIAGRSFNADVQQLSALYSAVQNCIEVTRYCL